MTPLRYTPVTAVPCGHCGGPSVRVETWTDGTYSAACAKHLDSPRQNALWVQEQ